MIPPHPFTTSDLVRNILRKDDISLSKSKRKKTAQEQTQRVYQREEANNKCQKGEVQIRLTQKHVIKPEWFQSSNVCTDESKINLYQDYIKG